MRTLIIKLKSVVPSGLVGVVELYSDKRDIEWRKAMAEYRNGSLQQGIKIGPGRISLQSMQGLFFLTKSSDGNCGHSCLDCELADYCQIRPELIMKVLKDWSDEIPKDDVLTECDLCQFDDHGVFLSHNASDIFGSSYSHHRSAEDMIDQMEIMTLLQGLREYEEDESPYRVMEDSEDADFWGTCFEEEEDPELRSIEKLDYLHLVDEKLPKFLSCSHTIVCGSNDTRRNLRRSLYNRYGKRKSDRLDRRRIGSYKNVRSQRLGFQV